MHTNVYISFLNHNHLAIDFVDDVVDFLATDKFYFSEYMHFCKTPTYIGKASENISSSVMMSE